MTFLPPSPARPEASCPHCVIAVPALNEAAHIEAALCDLLADDSDWPIIVADGGSTDATRSIVRALSARHPRISLIDNPERLQAAGVNRIARLGRAMGATVMIRADAHARYPRGLARGLVAALERANCDSVVIPLLPDPDAASGTGWDAAGAALQSTWLGTGGARHRRLSHSGPVDHGHHAAFRLSAFLAIGGYDPSFAANEDVEFDQRLVEAGGSIHFENRWPALYLPRNGPRALWSQYWRNGRWRISTAQKHQRPLGLRQILPLGPCLALVGAVALGPAVPAATLPLVTYLTLVLALSGHAGRGRPGQTLRIAQLAVTMHLAFGLGLVSGMMSPPWAAPPPPDPEHA